MSTIIKVENLGKQYRLGQVGTGTVSHDLNRWWHKIRGMDDPYLKIGESNDRTKKSNSNLVWVLRDINFDVNQGEVLGIIGRNGAGKSTLLKILSRVTSPSLGCIKVRGRIASLLEVGTGFHPELTGRENIFLNGAILGMTKSEIKNKFDEIVDFSGVERYIDTPVKRYSSGMYVRLAFAVAAHLEPEILIVDEVLAVGDAEFQEKCLGKMKDVSGQGRTVLFVSHNMAAVKSLCKTSLVMQNGLLAFQGDVNSGIEYYKSANRLKKATHHLPIKNNEICLQEIKIESLNESIFLMASELDITIIFENYNENSELLLRMDLWNDSNVMVLREEVVFFVKGKTKTGKYELGMKLPAYLLNYGNYFISLDFIDYKKRSILLIKEILTFEILSDVSPENISKRDINDAVIVTKLDKKIQIS